MWVTEGPTPSALEAASVLGFQYGQHLSGFVQVAAHYVGGVARRAVKLFGIL